MQATTPHEDRSLLLGEPADSQFPDDIEHWLRVYRELVDAIGEILEQMPTEAGEPPYGLQLRTRYEELVRGLEHWTDRAPQLSVL
jgi:hypothetical protein